MENKMFRIICLSLAVIMLLSVAGMELINASAYEGDLSTVKALEDSKYVTVKETASYIAFEPEGVFYNKGIIFYPGGNVDEVAYAPLMHAIAEEGYLCVIARMPLHLAVFDMDAADKIRENYKNIADWYMAGHSLGGAMAASYTAQEAEQINGLILLAAYSTEDLNDAKVSVLSIYGSEDKVLNMENYVEYQGNLPSDYTELVIEGGNHASFGNYGMQKQDGTAEISAEEQQAQAVEAICEFIQ